MEQPICNSFRKVGNLSVVDKRLDVRGWKFNDINVFQHTAYTLLVIFRVCYPHKLERVASKKLKLTTPKYKIFQIGH